MPGDRRKNGITQTTEKPALRVWLFLRATQNQWSALERHLRKRGFVGLLPGMV